MKIVVIYDSLHGNTKKVAEAVDSAFSEHDSKVVFAKDATLEDIENVELLVVGSPTHGGMYSENTKAFLDKIENDSLKGVKAAAFDTSTPQEGQGFFVNKLTKLFGNASPRIARILEKKGADVTTSEIFWVLGMEGPLKEGELERAKQWGAKLLK